MDILWIVLVGWTSSFQFYTNEEFCWDMAVKYELRAQAEQMIVHSICVPFEGTQEEYMKGE